MKTLYYVLKQDGTQDGPMELAVVHSAFKAGVYPEGCLVWCEGMDDWQPLSTLFQKCEYGNPLSALKHAFTHPSFAGRSTRKEFWMKVLGTLLAFLLVVLAFIGVLSASGVNGHDRAAGQFLVAFTILGAVLGLYLILPVLVRRLHDIGRSGWLLTIFVPAKLLALFLHSIGIEGPVDVSPILIVLFIVYCCMPGAKESNGYGKPAVDTAAGGGTPKHHKGLHTSSRRGRTTATSPATPADSGSTPAKLPAGGEKEGSGQSALIKYWPWVTAVVLIAGLVAYAIKDGGGDKGQKEHTPARGDAAIPHEKVEAGPTEAWEQFDLGMRYYEGIGIARNAEEAVKWLRKSAEQGDERAQFNLAVCYLHKRGVGYGYGTDEEAVKWFRKAAEQGNERAQYNLGVLYWRGDGVYRDKAAAAQWFEAAASNEHPRAQYAIAMLYYYGNGVAVDYVKAVQWLWKAANQGVVGAQFQLGVCYDTGKGVRQNFPEAASWYRKAAASGHRDALTCLQMCYDFKGNLVDNPMSQNYRWAIAGRQNTPRVLYETDDAMEK